MAITIKRFTFQLWTHEGAPDRLYIPHIGNYKYIAYVKDDNESVDWEDKKNPQKVKARGKDHSHTIFWLFNGHLYLLNDPELKPSDAIALANEEENKRRIQLEKSHALQAMREQLDSGKRREPITQDVKVTIWQRDQGRCVQCGSNAELEFDHIIPLAMGGSNTARNLQLLCAICNRRKGASLG
ncbi:HNH endonuclease [Hydrogenophaga taeniospiralis]|uniref:HNH endonuclease n=1 Tax=Hydrogenophaga taeniospiralis TaxID=65656 RepID=UPI001CFC36F3|nr:HNH endonuclease [Hydrogenophaga taeniospiralis]UCU95218.1 HNH endonuclease [Hydrogenophaga taeniospiralis]